MKAFRFTRKQNGLVLFGLGLGAANSIDTKRAPFLALASRIIDVPTDGTFQCRNSEDQQMITGSLDDMQRLVPNTSTTELTEIQQLIDYVAGEGEKQTTGARAHGSGGGPRAG